MIKKHITLSFAAILFAACSPGSSTQDESIPIQNGNPTAPGLSSQYNQLPTTSDLTQAIQHALNRALFLFDIVKFPPLKKQAGQSSKDQSQWVDHFPTFGREDLLSTDIFDSTHCDKAAWKTSDATYTIDFGDDGCQSGDTYLTGLIQIKFEKPIPTLLMSRMFGLEITFNNFGISTSRVTNSVLFNGSVAVSVVGNGSKRDLDISSNNLATTIGSKKEQLSTHLTGNLAFKSDWSTYAYYQLIFSGHIELLSDTAVQSVDLLNVQINQKTCKLNPISGQGSIQSGTATASFTFSPNCNGGLYVDTNGVPKYELFPQK